MEDNSIGTTLRRRRSDSIRELILERGCGSNRKREANSLPPHFDPLMATEQRTIIQ